MYTPQLVGQDVLVVLDALSIEKAHFGGYSWGTAIVISIARFYPERAISFIIGGGYPWGELTEEQIKKKLETEEAFKKYRSFFRRLEKLRGEKLTRETKQWFRKQNYAFKAIYAKFKGYGICVDRSYKPDYLYELEQPFLFYAGEKDGWDRAKVQEEKSKLMKNARAVTIRGFGHEVNQHADKVLPHIIEFLESVKKN